MQTHNAVAQKTISMIQQASCAALMSPDSNEAARANKQHQHVVKHLA
jgi:hypothetical protein